jgi:hypothetical protein
MTHTHTRSIHQYADLVNGLADQGIFQRGRAQGQGQGQAAASASSSNGVQSAAGKHILMAQYNTAIFFCDLVCVIIGVCALVCLSQHIQ